LAARRGSPEAAEFFRESLRLHAAAGNDFERARTELLFGREPRAYSSPREATPRAYSSPREATRSRTYSRSALATFERLGLEAWVSQARDALRTAEADPATESLTAQQMLIARMVAAGATNREVAAQLYLSTRTVDHHMRNIFVRLGIRSRIELAKLFA
jgi:DNA-binding CsgD family transcriptional regulator